MSHTKKHHAIESPIEKVQSFLKGHGIEYSFRPSSKEAPFDTISLALATTDENNPVLLQINSFENPLADPDASQNESTVRLLHFLAICTKTLPGEAAADLSRLIMQINMMLPLGSFVYNAVDKQFYLHFTHPSTTETIAAETLQAIFNSIVFAKEMFFDTLLDVAFQRTSLDEALASITDINFQK